MNNPFLKKVLERLWLIASYLFVGLVENAIFGWGDEKLGITNNAVEQVVLQLKVWGIPALTVLVLIIANEALHYLWFTKWRNASSTTTASNGNGEDFVSLKEAATLAYEEARKADSIWAYAAERLGVSGANVESAEDQVLNYMATKLAGELSLYGNKPPSRILELIGSANTKHGSFANGATEFHYSFARSPTYINLQVKRDDLNAALERLKHSLKSSDKI